MSLPSTVPAKPGGDVRLLVETIARALVDDGQQVRVEPVEEDDTTVLELTVAENDVGKVIGRQGRTARAIRTILAAVSVKQQKRYTLEILE